MSPTPPAAGTAGRALATEVTVIGGGIAGVATAYFLAKAGVPVMLFEKGRIAGEQSSRNWGWVRKQGRDLREIPAIVESLRVWEGLEKELEADLGWRQAGVTYVAETDVEMARYESWVEKAKAYQLDTRLLSAGETDKHLGQTGRRWKGAMHTASDGWAEPRKVMPAMARAAVKRGARMFSNCAVRTVETAGGRVSGIVTERGPVKCRAIVCAAGAWTRLFCKNLGIDVPQLGVTTSVLRTAAAPLVTESAVSCGGIAFRRRQDGGYTVAARGGMRFDLTLDALKQLRVFIPGFRMTRKNVKVRLSDAFWRDWSMPSKWGADDVTPFERVRMLDPAPDRAVLDRTLTKLRGLYPQFANVRVAEMWAGFVEVTPDAMPVMCPVDTLDGLFIATGFSGHGFGMGPGAGLLMSEMVQKGSARVDMTPFRLSRFKNGARPEPYAFI